MCKGPDFSTSLLTLSFDFLVTTILVGVKWHLVV